jgi:ABC-type transport system involved in cytochrome c biogenesis permease subunit
MKLTVTSVAAVLCAAMLAPWGAMAQPPGAGQWDDETIDLFESLPVQQGGRNKPMLTLSNFTLLPFNSKRSMDTPEDEKLTSTPWMMDVLFFPEQSMDYKHFVVDNTEILSNLGITAESARGRFSYNELKGGRTQLFTLAQQYAQKEADQRSSTEQMILNLAGNVQRFEFLAHYLDFARKDHTTGESLLLAELLPERSGFLLSDVLAKGDGLREAVEELQRLSMSEETRGQLEVEMAAFAGLFAELDQSIALALFPPSDPEHKEWYTPADLLNVILEGGDPATIEGELTMMASLERLAKSAGDSAAFKQELRGFHSLVVGQAEARGEYKRIPMEVTYYHANFFYNALALFVFSFILVALSWMMVGSKWMNRATWVAVVIPWAIMTAGITFRCIIQGRPPVTTLYETILFITAVAVLVALFIEYANRQRIALALASFMGMAGLFVANRYEMGDAQDTMPSLVAVLDTNFWLATHVTTVTIGYAAGMLASAVAHVYIFGKLFNLKKNDKTFYKTLTRMVYGIVCFGLLFSFVGTVLGGIWANYSWGRFWGWDPKENGAMMIVLVFLAMLHARLGGYIRDLGMHLFSVFVGMVVMFSHFGVNQLGVGLHSYGFTSGIWANLIAFWSVETFVILLGFVIFFRDRIRDLIAMKAKELAQAGGQAPVAK